MTNEEPSATDDVDCRACGDSGDYFYALGESPISCPHCGRKDLDRGDLDRLAQAAKGLSIVGVASSELRSLVAAARKLEKLKSAFEFVRLHHPIREPVDVYYCKSAERFLKYPRAMRACDPNLPKWPTT